MKIEQQLYGYRDGHRLLASSIDLDETLVWELVRATDRPSVSETELQEGITFGFAVSQDFYALCRTWIAKEVSRPGAVWTHVLLLPPSLDPPSQYFHFLHDVATPRPESFRMPIGSAAPPRRGQTNRLSYEAAQLLLLLAAKPQSGLRVISELSPIQVFLNAQEQWRNVLAGRAFSTSAGKKNIAVDKRSIIVSSANSTDQHHVDQPYMDLAVPKLPSKRIAKAWQLLNHDANSLRLWLNSVRSNFDESTSNLKLALETLLLGTGELDDNKLIQRVLSSSLESEDEQILKFVLGTQASVAVMPYPWVSALFLLGQQNWARWENFTWPEDIGETAASAPIDQLADRLLNLANGPEVNEALNVLSNSITSSDFEELSEYSLDAASVLIECNPDLLYTLPQAQRARQRFTSSVGRNAEERALELELSMFDWSPILWRRLVADRIRRTYREDFLRAYVVSCVNGGSWEQVRPEIQEFLLGTPKLLDALLDPNPTRRSVAVAIKEFDESLVRDRILDLIGRKRVKRDKLADALVDYYGVNNSIPLFANSSLDVSVELLASIADARWRLSGEGDVIEVIRDELTKHTGGDLTVVPIKNKKLRNSLEKKKQTDAK